MFAMMTIREIYRRYLQQLLTIYASGEATVITDWVFNNIAGLQRADILKNPAQHINPEILGRLNDCLALLLQHKPVQYVLGEAWFYKMKLRVTEDVLIPRPETEELVQLVIDDCRDEIHRRQAVVGVNQLKEKMNFGESSVGFSILDIGTGSGCIAIAVKKKLENVTMHAIDVSNGALSVAKENASDHQVAINFLALDFLAESNWELLPAFDVIISNPPYIPLKEKEGLARNVADFEPQTALFVPDDTPMIFYEKIALFGKKHLRYDGKIFAEIHEDHASEALNVFQSYFEVELKKDIFGKERIITAVNGLRGL